MEGAKGGGGLDGQLSQLLLNAAREGKVEVVRRILQSHEIPPDAPLLTADSERPLTLLEGTTAWWNGKRDKCMRAEGESERKSLDAIGCFSFKHT